MSSFVATVAVLAALVLAARVRADERRARANVAAQRPLEGGPIRAGGEPQRRVEREQPEDVPVPSRRRARAYVAGAAAAVRALARRVRAGGERAGPGRDRPREPVREAARDGRVGVEHLERERARARRRRAPGERRRGPGAVAREADGNGRAGAEGAARQ